MPLKQLFWLQLRICPLFLAPLHGRLDFDARPQFALTAYFAGPFLYTVVFTCRAMLAANETRGLAIRHGALNGACFGAMVMAPVVLLGIAGMLWHYQSTARRSPWFLLFECSNVLAITAVITAYHAALGVIGGLAAAVLHGAWRRRSSPAR